MFTPESFIQIQEWVPEAIEFVQKLKEDGCKVYILSNWDPTSFKLFHEKYADIFALFDGILISGNVGLLKPDPKVYELLVRTYGINKARAIFFDDQLVNVIAAQEVGLNSCVVKQKKSMFSGATPDVKNMQNEYHTWRFHDLESPALAAAAAA